MSLEHSQGRFEFTPEQRDTLQRLHGEPLHVPVQETNKVYLVVEEGVISTLDEEYIRQGLEHAAQQARHGKEGEWSPEEIMTAGREFLAQRNSLS